MSSSPIVVGDPELEGAAAAPVLPRTPLIRPVQARIEVRMGSDVRAKEESKKVFLVGDCAI
jgi:hypothetical protein